MDMQHIFSRCFQYVFKMFKETRKDMGTLGRKRAAEKVRCFSIACTIRIRTHDRELPSLSG